MCGLDPFRMCAVCLRDRDMLIAAIASVAPAIASGPAHVIRSATTPALNAARRVYWSLNPSKCLQQMKALTGKHGGGRSEFPESVRPCQLASDCGDRATNFGKGGRFIEADTPTVHRHPKLPPQIGEIHVDGRGFHFPV